MNKQKVVYLYIGIKWAARKDEVLAYVTIQINLEKITLSKKSQSQKNIYCMIHLYELSKVGKYRDRK